MLFKIISIESVINKILEEIIEDFNLLLMILPEKGIFSKEIESINNDLSGIIQIKYRGNSRYSVIFPTNDIRTILKILAKIGKNLGIELTWGIGKNKSYLSVKNNPGRILYLETTIETINDNNELMPSMEIYTQKEKNSLQRNLLSEYIRMKF